MKFLCKILFTLCQVTGAPLVINNGKCSVQNGALSRTIVCTVVIRASLEYAVCARNNNVLVYTIGLLYSATSLLAYSYHAYCCWHRSIKTI